MPQVPPIHDFIRELDRAWDRPTGEKTVLRIIGSTALMLQADYERGTKDSDILETDDLGRGTRARLLALAGKGTELHGRHRLCVEFVSSGFPLIPQKPLWLDVPDLNENLVHFHIEVLDVVDVVVSKLRRFHAHDVQDIEAMVDRGLVPHETLIKRFLAAVDCFTLDSRAEDLPKCVKNLNRVERDFLGVDETDIELPAWLADD